ncbi:unnamed protein product [Closterium sp. Naga37s-1]|nr:unnamed protein product [Closterium sp. Naga37s-1]
MAPHFPRRCSHQPLRRTTYRPLATRLLPLLALVFAALILPQNALAAQPAGSGWGWNVASAVSQLFSSLRAGTQTAQPTTTSATSSVKPAATGTCDPSSLSGYTSSIALASGLRLHWAVTATSTIQLAVEATRASGAGTGWFAVAWASSPGAMAPADAVMCNLATTPAIKAYRITGFTRFTRSTGDGSAVAVDVAGVNSLIWAFSASGSKTVAYHNGHYGSADVDFSCDASASATPAPPPPATSTPPPSTSAPPPPSTSAPPPPPSSSGGGSNCPASTLPGYTYQTQLKGSTPPSLPSSLLPCPFYSLLLHWKAASASQLDLAIEATAAPAKAGWIALAWAKGGKMAPSDAVFGNMAGGGVAAYKIGGYSMGSIQRTTAFSIGTANTTTTASGSTVVKFSRTQGTGSAAKVQVAGSNSLLWAYSPSGSKSLGFHGGA